jgi:hypothetical protein
MPFRDLDAPSNGKGYRAVGGCDEARKVCYSGSFLWCVRSTPKCRGLSGPCRTSRHFRRNLETFEPAELRAQVKQSWEREKSVATIAEFDSAFSGQLPFHFRDPRDPRIANFERRTASAHNSPAPSAPAPGCFSSNLQKRRPVSGPPLLFTFAMAGWPSSPCRPCRRPYRPGACPWGPCPWASRRSSLRW